MRHDPVLAIVLALVVAASLATWVSTSPADGEGGAADEGDPAALPRPELKIPSPYDNDGAFFLALERFGYDVTDGHAAVRAFQRRWRPQRIDGEIDGEISAILFALLLDRDTGKSR